MLLKSLLLACAATFALADDANICRITANYGCTQDGVNCNDDIGDRTPTLELSIFGGCPALGDNSGSDGYACCLDDKLNGGYCPTQSELEAAGFVVVGFGGTQKLQMKAGPAPIKCNQRGGPHYCFRVVRVGGANQCLDQGLYD